MLNVVFIFIIFYCTSCMTWHNRGAVAENVGFIALTSDISNPVYLGARQAQSCYWLMTEPMDINGPEHNAYAAFMAKLKEESVRYVTQVRSEHRDLTVFVPFLGGTSRCVIFYGEAYK